MSQMQSPMYAEKNIALIKTEMKNIAEKNNLRFVDACEGTHTPSVVYVAGKSFEFSVRVGSVVG